MPYYTNAAEANWEIRVQRLMNRGKLERKYRDHQLTGSLKDFRELHIQADWLLVYQIKEGELILLRLGSHSELFKT